MSQIVVFHGTEHKAGCTMAAQSVAELIAKEKRDITVLLAALNGRRSAEYMNENVVSIDEFKIQLKSGIGIDQNALSANKKIDNLFVISGVSKDEEVRCFLPGMAEALIETLHNKFDVIIIDSGSDLDNGLAFGALKMNGIKYLIMEQAESSVKRYERMKDNYEKLSICFDKYVLSKYFEDDPLTVNYVSSRLGIDKSLFFTVAHSDKGRISEIEYRTLLEIGGEKYKNDILKIVNDIMQAMNLEGIFLKRKRVWNSFI